MKSIFPLLLLIPLWLAAQQDENTGKKSVDTLKNADSLKVKAGLSITGFYQGGNVETLIFRASSDVSIKPFKALQFETKNSYVYQEFGKVKADEDILSLNFLHFIPEKRLSPLALGFFSTNFRREIDKRVLVGAGASFSIVKAKKHSLKMSLTGEYEETKFRKNDFNKDEFDGLTSIHTFRSTLWLKGRHELFKKKMILTHESYYQPSLEVSRNFRWRTDLGLELPVWKFLNFKVNYLRTFESVVIEGQKREDQFLTVGFTVKNYG